MSGAILRVMQPRATLRRHESASVSWEMATRPPHPALEGAVHRYVGYVERSCTPVSRREVPQDPFDLLDRTIWRRLEQTPRASPDVTWAWRRLRETSGRLAIGELAGTTPSAYIGCLRPDGIGVRAQVGA